MKKYVFDLDGTLVFTDQLNTDSYNCALESFGIDTIKNEKRITRKILESHITNISPEIVNKIVEEKKRIFRRNISDTCINIELFELLLQKNPNDCILWTSADSERVYDILDFYNIRSRFGKVILSTKNFIDEDINLISKQFNCSIKDIVFFENDSNIIEKLTLKNLFVYQVE